MDVRTLEWHQMSVMEFWTLVTQLFVQQLKTNIKENINGLHHYTFVRRIHQWITASVNINGSVIKKFFGFVCLWS